MLSYEDIILLGEERVLVIPGARGWPLLVRRNLGLAGTAQSSKCLGSWPLPSTVLVRSKANTVDARPGTYRNLDHQGVQRSTVVGTRGGNKTRNGTSTRQGPKVLPGASQPKACSWGGL